MFGFSHLCLACSLNIPHFPDKWMNTSLSITFLALLGGLWNKELNLAKRKPVGTQTIWSELYKVFLVISWKNKQKVTPDQVKGFQPLCFTSSESRGVQPPTVNGLSIDKSSEVRLQTLKDQSLAGTPPSRVENLRGGQRGRGSASRRRRSILEEWVRNGAKTNPLA